MPELPEVETIAADLRPHLIGRTIERCELAFPTIVRHPEPERFIDVLADFIDSTEPARMRAEDWRELLTAT